MSKWFDLTLQSLHETFKQDKFSLVFNEMEDGTYKLFVVEEKEFATLIHITLDFTKVTYESQCQYYRLLFQSKDEMIQRYLKQKMILVQRNRECMLAMFEIN